MSAFAKCYVTGPGAEAWLDSLMANRIPKAVGRIHLCHMLTQERRRALGVHHLSKRAAGVLSGLGRRAGAARPRLPVQGAAGRRQRADVSGHDRNGACWCWRDRARATCCRSSPTPIFPTRLPLAYRQEDRCRPRTGACAAGQLRRRARLGAAPPDRDAEHDLRPGHGCRAGVRHQAVRHPGDDGDGDGEVLPAGRAASCRSNIRPRIRARPLRASEQGPVHRPRRAGRMAACDGDKWQFVTHGGATASPMPTRAAPSRSGRGDRAGRPRDERRLRLAAGQVAGARHGSAGARRSSAPSWISRFSASAGARRSSRKAPTTRRTSAFGREARGPASAG